jgi:hypothetical protein
VEGWGKPVILIDILWQDHRNPLSIRERGLPLQIYEDYSGFSTMDSSRACLFLLAFLMLFFLPLHSQPFSIYHLSLHNMLSD